MQQIKELLKELCKLNEKRSKDINSDITKFISQCSKIHKELRPLSQVASNTNLFKEFEMNPNESDTPLTNIQVMFSRENIVFRVLSGIALKMSNRSKPCITYKENEIPLKPKFIKNYISDFSRSHLFFGISYIYEHLDELKDKYEQVVINELQEKVEVLRKGGLNEKAL